MIYCASEESAKLSTKRAENKDIKNCPAIGFLLIAHKEKALKLIRSSIFYRLLRLALNQK